ncbi:type II secretion system protein [Bacillus sp. MM2020_1]|nr:type II secretion system protein [Bacillus sp. MM2020_1]
MVTIKNEKGYTLILVMIIITVTMILGLALSSAAFSTRKEFDKTDNRNRATDLAEMGITYYQAAINNLIAISQGETKANKTDFCSEFLIAEGKNKALYSSKLVDPNGDQYIVKKTTENACSNTGSFKFTFSSTGTTNSGEVKQLQGTIAISQIRTGIDNVPDYSKFTDSGINKQLNTSKEFSAAEYPNGVSFTPGLTIVGGNILTVVKSAYFESLEINGGSQVIVQEDAIIKQITSVNGNTNLKIYGDAIFLSTTPRIDKISGQADICIYGNIYTVQTIAGKQVLVDYNDFSTYFRNSCQNSNSSWTVNPESGVTVTYQ